MTNYVSVKCTSCPELLVRAKWVTTPRCFRCTKQSKYIQRARSGEKTKKELEMAQRVYKNLSLAKKMETAFRLRMRGMTVREIGLKIGMSYQWVFKVIKPVEKQIAEDFLQEFLYGDWTKELKI